MKASFLPLVLKDKNIGGLYASSMLPLGIALVVVLIRFIRILILALTGGYQKQIKAYIAKSVDPDAAYGYSPDIARYYNVDPAAFQRKVQAARRAEGKTATTTAE